MIRFSVTSLQTMLITINRYTLCIQELNSDLEVFGLNQALVIRGSFRTSSAEPITINCGSVPWSYHEQTFILNQTILELYATWFNLCLRRLWSFAKFIPRALTYKTTKCLAIFKYEVLLYSQSLDAPGHIHHAYGLHRLNSLEHYKCENCWCLLADAQ